MADSVKCGHCKTVKPATEFAPSQRSNGKWCRACFKATYRETRPAAPPIDCEVCGTCVFEPLPKQRFCSPKCKAKARYWRLNPRQQRTCRACGLDITEMRRDTVYCSNRCAMRVNVGRSTSEQRRARRLVATYGITPEVYDRLLADQGGGCSICGADGSVNRGGLLHVDHCHTSGRIRGLLCNSCNLGLGKFRDHPALLRRAAEYVEAAAS